MVRGNHKTVGSGRRRGAEGEGRAERGWRERWGQTPWGPETHAKELKLILEPKEAEEGFYAWSVLRSSLHLLWCGEHFPRSQSGSRQVKEEFCGPSSMR